MDDDTNAATAESFSELGVSEWLVDVARSMGLKRPTEIQTRCIPKVLAGQDVIGRAKTGSGKTAAFALPMLQQLGEDPFGIFGVVLTPTRELAFQIADQFRAFGVPLDLRCVVVCGGMDMCEQSLQLVKRPHILVCTPGRLADHLRSGTDLHLEHVQYLVLDEADRLFESCFDRDMATIRDALPSQDERQTLLFSATMTADLADKQAKSLGLQRPCYCEVHKEEDTFVKELDQRYLFIPQNVKEAYLAHILRQQEEQDSACIVFVSTCRGAEIITQTLVELEIDVVSLHSRKDQRRRLAALGKFRSGKAKVLVATDVASRGLDIPTVKLVVNYDVPRVVEDYVHRVGRTARAGRGGVAVTVVSQYDIDILKQIEEFVGKEMQEFTIPEDEVLEKLQSVNSAKRMARIRLEQFDAKTEELDKVRKRRRRRDIDAGVVPGDAKARGTKGKQKKGKKKQKKQKQKSSKAK